MAERSIYRLDSGLVADEWQQLGEDDAVPAGASIIVPLTRWQEQAEALRAQAGRIGLYLPNTEDVEALADSLRELPLIALQFPAFTDGRAFSQARLLREAVAYTGELRACGEILSDQLLYLARCGFDSFERPADAGGERFEAALRDFSVAYQPTNCGPQLRAAG